MKKYLAFGSLLFVLNSYLLTSYAADQHDMHGVHKSDAKEHKHVNKEDEHHSTPHWAKTLSKEQKAEVDRMHHELDSKQKVLKEDEAVKQKELNNLTITDNTKQSEINNKIDELMAIKNKILRNRYEHLVEMRQILNKEQRVSYDEAILKRDEIK